MTTSARRLLEKVVALRPDIEIGPAHRPERDDAIGVWGLPDGRRA
jgi:hypothetical protein